MLIFMKNNWTTLLFCAVLGLFGSCVLSENDAPLPILGPRSIGPQGDTVYPQVPDFQFVNQDSQVVTNATFAGKAYVVDFFFIHCPTICPKVTANCFRIYQKYQNDDRLLLLAHTVDTRHDTVPALREYARKIGVHDSRKWHFVTGETDAVYGIADEYFLTNPSADADAEGGFNHDGRLVLVDKNRHVRAFCDGTDAEDVDRFMRDIDRLLKEQYPATR
jgi:protein SCO1/2